jgi:hypothetical protein
MYSRISYLGEMPKSVRTAYLQNKEVSMRIIEMLQCNVHFKGLLQYVHALPYSSQTEPLGSVIIYRKLSFNNGTMKSGKPKK